MKYIIGIAVLSLMFAGVAYATEPDVYGCTDPVSPSYNELATIDDGSCYYPSNGPICAINGTCPCMGLQGDFLKNCEIQNAPLVEEPMLGGVIEPTRENLMRLIIELQMQLVGLLQQLMLAIS